jgi:hypothetical protein
MLVVFLCLSGTVLLHRPWAPSSHQWPVGGMLVLLLAAAVTVGELTPRRAGLGFRRRRNV